MLISICACLRKLPCCFLEDWIGWFPGLISGGCFFSFLFSFCQQQLVEYHAFLLCDPGSNPELAPCMWIGFLILTWLCGFSPSWGFFLPNLKLGFLQRLLFTGISTPKGFSFSPFLGPIGFITRKIESLVQEYKPARDLSLPTNLFWPPLVELSSHYLISFYWKHNHIDK